MSKSMKIIAVNNNDVKSYLSLSVWLKMNAIPILYILYRTQKIMFIVAHHESLRIG